MKDVIKKSRGFTLVEAMVAVTLVTLSVAGPLYGASRALVAADLSKDQLTASYLAQEGVEYVREMRDDEYLATYKAAGVNVSDHAWDYFLNGGGQNPLATISSCRSTATYCTLDPFRNMGTGSVYSIQICSPLTSCPPLYLSASQDGYYTQQNIGTKTQFTRTIQVLPVASANTDSLGNPTDVRVVSTVSWNSHGIPRTVTVTDHLTPWQ